MFLPNDPALLEGHPVNIVDVDGHVVLIEDAGRQYKVLETSLKRPFETHQTRMNFPPPILSRQLTTELAMALGKMELDWNGHHQNGEYWKNAGWRLPEEQRRSDLFWLMQIDFEQYMTQSQLESILTAFKEQKPLEEWITVGVNERNMCCPFCDQKFFHTNGVTVRPTSPCLNPNGLVTEFTLNVPSGKMVIANDLRDLCRIPNDHDINGIYGTHLAILDYASNGLACGFGIGNTCPTVSRHKDARFTIGCRQGGRRVTSICTDLWAYSIMDYEEALRRAEYYGCDLEETKKSLEDETITVPAGLYKFRHFHNIDRDADKVLFAEFKRVGPAWPFEDDFISRDKDFTVHFSQAAQVLIQKWPSLYNDAKNVSHQFARVAYSQLGSCLPERDWHQNGHRNDFLAREIETLPIVEIPHFRFMYSWRLRYSVIETSVNRKDDLFGGEGVLLNDSYAIAAGRVLESAISFGIRPDLIYHKKEDPRYGEYTIPESRAEMHRAAQLWYGLVERYPHVAVESPTFAKWMENRETVVNWIDSFDLGPLKIEGSK